MRAEIFMKIKQFLKPTALKIVIFAIIFIAAGMGYTCALMLRMAGSVSICNFLEPFATVILYPLFTAVMALSMIIEYVVPAPVIVITFFVSILLYLYIISSIISYFVKWLVAVIKKTPAFKPKS